MPDIDFAETMILLVEHAADGAYGLTLNQPTDLTVKGAWAQNNDRQSKWSVASLPPLPIGTERTIFPQWEILTFFMGTSHVLVGGYH